MKSRANTPPAGAGAVPASAHEPAPAESTTPACTTPGAAQASPRLALLTSMPSSKRRRLGTSQAAAPGLAAQPAPVAASDEPTKALPVTARSEVLKSPELRLAVFAQLGQSHASTGSDLLPRARALANIRTTSRTLHADVAALMAQPGATDIGRVFNQQSVQRAITQLARPSGHGRPELRATLQELLRTFVHGRAEFRAALQELLKDKQDVGVDLVSMIDDNAFLSNNYESDLFEVLKEKTDLKSLDVHFKEGERSVVENRMPALVAIQANNPALESFSVDYPSSTEFRDHTRQTNRILGLLPQLATLTKLTRLNLMGHGGGHALATAVAALTNLTSLNVAGNRLDDADVARFAVLTKLTSLNVGGNLLDSAGVAGFAALTNLTSLDLSHNRIDTVELRTALGTLAGALPKLNSLNIGGISSGGRTDGAHLIAASNGFANLTSLGIASNALRPADVVALAAMHPGLVSLDIGWWPPEPGGLAALAALPNLTRLDMNGSHLTVAQVKELAALPKLRSLILRRSRLDAAVGTALIELTTLTALDLRDTREAHGPLRQATRDALRAMPNMRQLKI